jgi:hypothetical protein
MPVRPTAAILDRALEGGHGVAGDIVDLLACLAR